MPTWHERCTGCTGIDFGIFMKHLICREILCAAQHVDKRFDRVLVTNLNFLVSDVITVYCFHTLISEFGSMLLCREL